MSKGAEHFDFTKCSSSSDHGLEDIGHFLQRHTSTGSGIGHCPVETASSRHTKSFFTAELTRSHQMHRSRSGNLRRKFLGREKGSKRTLTSRFIVIRWRSGGCWGGRWWCARWWIGWRARIIRIIWMMNGLLLLLWLLFTCCSTIGLSRAMRHCNLRWAARKKHLEMSMVALTNHCDDAWARVVADSFVRCELIRR